MNSPEDTCALIFANVGKTFREKTGKSIRALDNVSLTLKPGSIVALVGPDGAGKTTLLRIAAGLLAPDEGTFSLFGETVSDNTEGNSSGAFARIGYMPQRFGLYEDLSVQENLNLYADLRGLEENERENRYAELLKMTGLSKFTNRLAGQLSGGMKQKLGLICTLVKAPDILLLDEPTVGVDPLSRRELWEIVANLTGKSGAGKSGAEKSAGSDAHASNMSVIVSTAYLDEAARCDEILLLFEGKTLARETPRELKERSKGAAFLATPAGGEAPRLLQSRLLTSPGIIDAVPEGGKVRLVHGELAEKEQAELEKRLQGASSAQVESSLEDSFMMLLKEAAPKREHPVPDIPETGKAFDAAVNGNGGPVIETKNVTKKFGDFAAVNNVSFSVNRGEVFGLLGPNGAGKTTTFRMLCGLLPATSGSLHVAGVDVRVARSDARRRIGYVAQKFSLYGLLTVRENLEFFAGAYGLFGKEREDRMNAVLEDFSLASHMDSAAEHLPGGNKQRLAMAVGLLHQPQILFLDEPTSGADPLARREFWLRISTLAAGGVTIIVTTHFMEEAEYCDRILIQDSGVMLALDTPAAIREQTSAPNMEEAFIRIVEKARRENGNGSPENGGNAA